MEKTLQFFNSAKRDINLNSIPHRIENDKYQWSNGQLEILNHQQYNPLRLNNDEVKNLADQLNMFRRELLVFKKPANKLEQEGDDQKEKIQLEIDEEEHVLQVHKSELNQFDEDMFNRGFNIPEIKDALSKSNENKEKPKSTTWKTVLNFLGIWLVGEIFMTYVQWNGLREEKGIGDLIIRSLSFAVVLFLIHYVAHLYKKDKRTVYPVFLSFNLVMLLTMLFAPLVLNKLYPNKNETTSVSQQWSITNNIVNTESAETHYPFWVEFYRDNEVIPAILCFLFFVAMQSFNATKEKTAPTNLEVQPKTKDESEQEEIKRRRRYLLAKIRDSEHLLDSLRTKLSNVLSPSTRKLKDILNQIETKTTEAISIEKRITSIKTESETLLKALEEKLDNYKTEYLDALRNDQVKAAFITPEWNNRNDIFNFFKIQIV